MASVFPAINADCAASIISYLDKLSLISIASTSKAGKAAALPLLVHTVELYTNSGRHARIISFSRYVLSNQLGHFIRHLRIWHVRPKESEANPEFLPAMQPLVDLVAASDNLTSLTINDSSELFRWAPGLTDAICAHPPSHTLKLGCVNESDWLCARPFSGLRHLHLSFDFAEDDPDIFTITAPSAKTLNTVCLGGAQFRFKEGDVPCEAVHMVSFQFMTTTPMDIHRAFPNIRFIEMYQPPSQLSAASGYGPEILPELIALNGELDSHMHTLTLAPHHDIRVLRLQSFICRKSELEQVVSALRANSLFSLSLDLSLAPDFDEVSDAQRLSADLVFSRLLQISSQLKFMHVNIYEPRFGITQLEEACDYMSSVCFTACEHIANLQHLKVVVLGFCFNSTPPDCHTLRNIAKECFRSLPLVDYFVVDLEYHMICVTRRLDPYSWTGTRKIGDDGGILSFLIDGHEGRRIMNWYRWEGSDARLAGAREWLESMTL